MNKLNSDLREKYFNKLQLAFNYEFIKFSRRSMASVAFNLLHENLQAWKSSHEFSNKKHSRSSTEFMRVI